MINWIWTDNPLGVPLDPDDDDMAGPRSKPYVSLCMEFKEGGIVLRQGLNRHGRTLDSLTKFERNQMMSLLLNWLEENR